MAALKELKNPFNGIERKERALLALAKSLEESIQWN